MRAKEAVMIIVIYKQFQGKVAMIFGIVLKSIGFGDSGGPAACQTRNGVCLAGATSHGGNPCAQRGNPTVFTNVAHLYDFYSC